MSQRGMYNNSFRRESKPPLPPVPVRENTKGRSRSKNPRSMLLGLLPSSVYNPKSKKILGFLDSEDLLLIALIFLFMEREDEDQTVILVLLYILMSDYIDLPFDF